MAIQRDPSKERPGRRTSDPAPPARSASPSTPTIVVCDRQGSRLAAIETFLRTCGARSFPVDEFAHLEDLQFSLACSTALVGLTGGISENEDLAAIRLLRQKGFQILSYGDNLRSWQLTLRCQALLAGARQLLDSAGPNFASDLQVWITHLVQAETAKQREEEEVSSVISRLGIIGKSAPMISVFQRLLRVSALSDLPVLLVGETGTGKELLAHALYSLDPKRKRGPFVTLNCGALSVGLLESELFGHRRGAFTGAEQNRKGLIRSADGGVLFLDEIGELDTGSQVKLLRVLQENLVLPVGEDEEVRVSVRVIAATNRQLEEMVQKKSFREDLFYRLNVVAISIPPLRERPEDMRPLVEHFLQKHQSIVDGRKIEPLDEFVAALTRLELRGNVRQLENLVRQVLVNKADDGPLMLTDLPREIWQTLTESGVVASRSATGSSTGTAVGRESKTPDLSSQLIELLAPNGSNLQSSLERCERILIEAALLQARGNQSKAGRLLGITPRSVYNKLRKHHLQA
jgi:transcriptional regulator with PAS, ATPase and Fis domain